MTAGRIIPEVVTERILWVRKMTEALRELPVTDKGRFLATKHTVAAAESYLRRALEALFDLGRHVLAKKFGLPATEYKEIATGLLEKGVIDEDSMLLMRMMAGYRNRMVHFYNEIGPDELFDICSNHLGELDLLLERITAWIRLQDEMNPRTGPR
jgi:uncharacterized protein YutE (UPF0331/DUF86 family)